MRCDVLAPLNMRRGAGGPTAPRQIRGAMNPASDKESENEASGGDRPGAIGLLRRWRGGAPNIDAAEPPTPTAPEARGRSTALSGLSAAQFIDRNDRVVLDLWAGSVPPVSGLLADRRGRRETLRGSGGLWEGEHRTRPEPRSAMEGREYSDPTLLPEWPARRSSDGCPPARDARTRSSSDPQGRPRGLIATPTRGRSIDWSVILPQRFTGETCCRLPKDGRDPVFATGVPRL